MNSPLCLIVAKASSWLDDRLDLGQVSNDRSRRTPTEIILSRNDPYLYPTLYRTDSIILGTFLERGHRTFSTRIQVKMVASKLKRICNVIDN